MEFLWGNISTEDGSVIERRSHTEAQQSGLVESIVRWHGPREVWIQSATGREYRPDDPACRLEFCANAASLETWKMLEDMGVNPRDHNPTSRPQGVTVVTRLYVLKRFGATGFAHMIAEKARELPDVRSAEITGEDDEAMNYLFIVIVRRGW